MKKLFGFLLIASLPAILFAQKSLEEVLFLKAVVSSEKITIEWMDDESTTPYVIHKRSKGAKDWEKIGEVAGSSGSYADSDVSPHEAYEYQVVKMTGATRPPVGYLYSGFEVSEIASHGEIILLIDSVIADSLAPELNRLESDLMGEGWMVESIYAGRSEEVKVVKERIVNASGENTTALLILGHIPVPYSGFFLTGQVGFVIPPDGHDDHIGAWAADVFYGDLDGEWTDETAYVENERFPENANIPGDGKFDQSRIPSDIELEVGRVDFHNMPAFTKTEIGLMKDYLDRNHSFRVGEWQVVERAVIDDNFKSLNLSLTGQRNFTAMLDFDSVHQKLDYLEAQSSGFYLWSYGCGAGTPTSCKGLNGNSSAVAHTRDFASLELQNIFTITAGSYFGDWDKKDNFLRAPLCNSALTNFWGGIPQWYVHHMALGETIGYGTKISQNNFDHFDYGEFNALGGVDDFAAWRGVQMALMGDPTLTMKYPQVPTNLKAVAQNGAIELTWDAASGDVDGYNVYRRNEKGEYKKANDDVITTTSFTDNTNWFSGKYTYAVRSVKLETTPSGSYFNVGGGAMTDVDHVNGLEGVSISPLSIYPNPVKDWLSVNFETSFNGTLELGVHDLLGKEVVDGNFRAQMGSAPKLDIAHLHQGVYVLVIKKEGLVINTMRFYKE